MTPRPTAHERDAFYAAAVVGLRALDLRERTPRRFGAEADARWMQFGGALGAGDRIDILLRDAAGTWGAAFSPAECFDMFGLAEDEPFGPDWVSIDDNGAKRLLAEPNTQPTLETVAFKLGGKAIEIAVPPIMPSTKLVVAGAAAIGSVARAFADNRALSWTDQVAVVSSKPAFRQLAGLAAVLLGARGRTALALPGESEAALRAAGFAYLDAAVVSPDAEPEAAEFVRKLGGK